MSENGFGPTEVDIVISDPDDIAKEALFSDVHQLRREFLAGQLVLHRDH